MLGGCESEERVQFTAPGLVILWVDLHATHQQMQTQKVEINWGGILTKNEPNILPLSYSVTFFRHHKQCVYIWVHTCIYIYMKIASKRISTCTYTYI